MVIPGMRYRAHRTIYPVPWKNINYTVFETMLKKLFLINQCYKLNI